jgi:hypothetical protein
MSVARCVVPASPHCHPHFSCHHLLCSWKRQCGSGWLCSGLSGLSHSTPPFLCPSQDDFLLIHYDKGPCRNKLGHSRASVIWHRTQVRGSPSVTLISGRRRKCVFVCVCVCVCAHTCTLASWLKVCCLKRKTEGRSCWFLTRLKLCLWSFWPRGRRNTHQVSTQWISAITYHGHYS